MTIFRSARLETLLGTTVSEATYDNVHRLVDNAIPEDSDLDYKKTRYGKSDDDKRELSTDAAALANAAGGLIILGIEEDDQSRAARAPGVDLNNSDQEINRIYEIIASGVAPLLQTQVYPLPGPDGKTGLIVIAVPTSPDSPHAVVMEKGGRAALRFPRRNGTTTVYWREAELAAAYRDRFTRERDQGERLARYEHDLTQQLDTGTRAFVVVSLLPDRPGAMRIDARAAAEFQKEVLGKRPMIAGLATNWRRTSVGPRRLFASSSAKAEIDAPVVAELHADGGGAFASRAGGHHAEEGSLLIEDELLVLGVLSGLRLLGQHARDRTATAGNASLRATIHPVTDQAPAVLYHQRDGDFEAAGERTVRSAPVGTAVADIDQLAQGGPELVAAAYRLASDLGQAFGAAEACQLTPEGALREPYWRTDRQEVLEPWAKQVGVEWVEDTLPFL